MRKFLLCAAMLLASLPLFSQLPVPVRVWRPHYVFFSNVDRAATEVKINDLAVQGYRLVGLQCTFGHQTLLIVAMEDILGEESRYEYKLLDGRWWPVRHASSLIVELNDAAAQGYHVVRGSLLFSPPDAWASQMNEHALAVERQVGSSEKYEYRLVKREIKQHFLDDLQATVHDGFEPLMFHARETRYLLAEKGPHTELPLDPGERTTESGRQKMVNTFIWPGLAKINRPIDTVEQYQTHARENFEKEVSGTKHILTVSTAQRRFGAIVADLPGSKPGLQIWASGTVRADELLSHSAVWFTLEKEMNEAASKGYVLVEAPAFTNDGNFTLSKYTTRALAVMEPANGAPPVRYRILAADTLPELATKVNTAFAEGWHVIPGLLYGDSLIFLQKAEVKP